MARENTPNEAPAHNPYIPATESPAEFSLRAIGCGIVLGVIFGAANAYLGLRAGLTISTSIPIAVMTVAVFRAFRMVGARASLLEANLSQTTGSASSSIASGTIFTLPALFMWGMPPSLLQMTLLALAGGLLGVLFMIPLRRFLIEREHHTIPYPEGTACAEVLVASEVGGAQAKNVFYGLGFGAAFKFIFGWLHLAPERISATISTKYKAALSGEASAALFGVGYILGPRIGAIMVGGGLLSSLVIIPAIAIWGAKLTTPLFPEEQLLIPDMSPSQIWNRYVRYIGAGAVATAGFITLIKSIPTIIESIRIGVQEMRKRVGAADAAPRTSRDLSLKVVLMGALTVGVALTVVPLIFDTLDNIFARLLAAVAVVIFAFFFVTVSSRIVGLVGQTSNPTSGMTIATLLLTSLIFFALGWRDETGKAAALTVGCVVAIAASIAGDTSQDLKTGFLLGATPARQQIGELIGILTSSVFVCMTLLMLNEAYGTTSIDPVTGAEVAVPGFGSQHLPAPQATLMKLVIEGVLDAKLPWMLILIGVGLAFIAEFILRIPSLAFAVGVYLPVSTMVPVFFGGMLRYWLEKSAKSETDRNTRRENGVLFGSGLVGGAGLMGVVIAGVMAYLASTTERTAKLPPIPGKIGYENGLFNVFALDGYAAPATTLILFAGLAWIMTLLCKRRSESST
ncbi:MAG: OPT family oligopeptide transporter [Phycisphaerae bacterium]